MKKALVIILAAVMVISVAGACSKSPEVPDESTHVKDRGRQTEEIPAVTEDTAEIEEKGVIGEDYEFSPDELVLVKNGESQDPI